MFATLCAVEFCLEMLYEEDVLDEPDPLERVN